TGSGIWVPKEGTREDASWRRVGPSAWPYSPPPTPGRRSGPCSPPDPRASSRGRRRFESVPGCDTLASSRSTFTLVTTSGCSTRPAPRGERRELREGSRLGPRARSPRREGGGRERGDGPARDPGSAGRGRRGATLRRAREEPRVLHLLRGGRGGGLDAGLAHRLHRRGRVRDLRQGTARARDLGQGFRGGA